MTVPVALAGVSGILSVSGISRKRCKTSPSSSLTLKASFVQPLSLASARQLSWQESPWQRGFVFDETDLRLLENVTECQSLSLWERWHCEAMTERASPVRQSCDTAIIRSFVRAMLSPCLRIFVSILALSVPPLGTALPAGEPFTERFTASPPAPSAPASRCRCACAACRSGCALRPRRQWRWPGAGRAQWPSRPARGRRW